MRAIHVSCPECAAPPGQRCYRTFPDSVPGSVYVAPGPPHDQLADVVADAR